jgi:acyl-CoA thioester hydrolase
MWHGAYLNIFDDARIESFRQVDYTYARVLEEGWLLVIRRVECEYFAPAYMDDVLQVGVSISGMTRATLKIGYECSRGAERLARGLITYAFVDAAGKPLRVPATLRTVIEGDGERWGYPPSRSETP